MTVYVNFKHAFNTLLSMNFPAFSPALPKDFGYDVVHTLDTAMYLADLRDKESAVLNKLYASEVKASAKARGIPFKSNMKKADLINLLVHTLCHYLRFAIGYGPT